MKAAKSFIVVVAGTLPFEEVAKYTRRWDYDSDDYEADRQAPSLEATIFSKRMREAYDYAIGLSNPRHVNWVRVDWIWV